MRYIVFLFLLLPGNTLAQTISAAQTGVGHQHYISEDATSVFGNPAAFTNTTIASISTHSSWLVKELNQYSAGLGLRSRQYYLSLNMNYSGYELYNKKSLAFSIGKSLASTIKAGISFNYSTVTFGDIYGSSFLFSGTGGLVYQPFTKLHIAFLAEQLSFNNSTLLSSVIALSTNYKLAVNTLILVETEKNADKGTFLKTGLIYKLPSGFDLRSGIKIPLNDKYETSFAFGCGYLKGKLKTDMAFSYQFILGFSPYVTLYYEFQ